jgi:cytochrome c peroxidase
MRFEPESIHGANNGLEIARALMERIKAEFPWISYGDLWTLAGVAAVQEMAGPKIPWRPGRIDGFAKDATPDGRLPDASQGAPHVRNIFNRMGYSAFPPLREFLSALLISFLQLQRPGDCRSDRRTRSRPMPH